MRSWGTHVFRIGSSAPYIFQAPRPLLDQNSFESAAALFGRLKGRALLTAGAHARTNADGSADLRSAANANNLLNLASQVILRESRREPTIVVEVAAFRPRKGQPQLEADVLVAVAGKSVGHVPGSLPIRRLLDVLDSDGMKFRMVDGKADTIGYEVGPRAPSLYSNIWPHQNFVMLWMSAGTRSTYQQKQLNTGEAVKFLALEIPTNAGNLVERVGRSMTNAPFLGVPKSLARALDRYVETGDIVALRHAQAAVRNLKIERFIDSKSQQAFALIIDQRGSLHAIANLTPREPQSRISISSASGIPESVDRFIESRTAWLVLGESA